MLGALFLGCAPSSLSASREVDGAFADGAGPGRLLADASQDARHPYYDADPRQKAGADAGVNCLHVGGVGSNPRYYCAVRCKSMPPTSDVQVWLDQTSVPQIVADGPVPSFIVRIVQTVPTPCDQTFSDVQTLWSGQFMNFSGQNSQWQFHLLAARGYYTDANVEVYPLGTSIDSGPVSVGPADPALGCEIFTF